MKAYLIGCAMLAVVWAQAAPKQLKGYAEVLKALESGEHVRLVVDYSKTKLTREGEEPSPGPDAIGGMPIESWEKFGEAYTRDKREYFAFSETVLIFHPSFGGVQNYVGFRVYKDGSVLITARYLKPQTLEIEMEMKLTAAIDDGTNDGAIRFFAGS